MRPTNNIYNLVIVFTDLEEVFNLASLSPPGNGVTSEGSFTILVHLRRNSCYVLAMRQ